MRPLWKDVKLIGTQIIPIETERIVSYSIDMYIRQLYISICIVYGSYTYQYVYTAVIYISICIHGSYTYQYV